MATTSFPTDKQLPNTDNIIRQTDCSYSFQQEAVSLTLKFMGDVKEAVGLAAAYRAGTRVAVSDLTGKFTELNNVLPTSQLEASGKVTASTSTTKTGSGTVSITVSVPYKTKIAIGSGAGNDPEKRIITTWAEKSTDYEFPLEIYAGEGQSASEANAGNLEAWKQERMKNIQNYKEFKYSVEGEDEPVELEGRTLDLAKKIYDGIESVRRAYPEVIRTTQYLNYKADEDSVDDTLIKQITRKPPNLYYRDQTPHEIWKSLFDNFDWLKSAYDVNCEATEYQKLWNITVTECWMGCDKDEKGPWDDDLYGADGVRWKFSTANQPQPSGQYEDGTPIAPTDVNGNGRIKPDTFQNQNDIKDLDTGGDFYAVDDNSFKATPTRSLTAGVPDLETIKMPEINYIGNDAFNGAANLKSIRVENQVTFLGTNAFKGCTSLTEAHFAPSIYTMPASTFEGCTSLDIPPDEETMKIGGLINAVGANAFKDCTSLTAIEFENAITSIGANAFDGDAELKFFGVPTDSTGTITLGDEAFKGCAKLADIELPVGTITLGTDTFDGAFDDEVTVKAPKSFLTNLPVTSSYNYIYPAFVDTIANDEFRNDTKLLSVVVPNTVTTMGTWAFAGCTNLVSATLPDNLTKVNSATFDGCTSLTEVTYDGPITLIGSQAFKGCTSLTSAYIPETVTLVGSYAWQSCPLVEVDIPSTINLQAGVFQLCTALKSVKAPESQTGSITLAARVFDRCSALERIEFPVGTITIADTSTLFVDALASEIWLKAPFNADLVASIPAGKAINFIYPSFVTTIAADEWRSNTQIKSVAIPSSVTTMNDSAFRQCTNLTSAVLNNATIGDHAFTNCSSLTDVSMTTATSIGRWAFQGCTALTEIELPDTLTTIAQSAFIGCTSLESIDLPETVTSIASTAFQGCTALDSVILPENETGTLTLGDSVFNGCSALERLDLPVGTLTVGSTVFNNALANESWIKAPFNSNLVGSIPSGKLVNYIYPSFTTSIAASEWRYSTVLKSAAIPDGVTSIGNRAFSECSNLASVNFPDSLTTIGDKAFSSCYALTSLTLPDNSTSIGSGAFEYCTGLATITVPLAITSIGSNAFQSAGSSTALPEVTMTGRTVSTVQGMTNYPWGLRSGTTVHCSDGDITIS